MSLGPIPETITGSCLCTALRYKITFPPSHDFAAASRLCQCTQCRKQTGGLFLAVFFVPASALAWTTPTEALKTYSATPGAQRGFCGSCGSFLYWRSDEGKGLSLSIGTVDPLYLFGEGAGETNEEVPEGGFGMALCNGLGGTEWCFNEVKGVTDDMPLLHAGKRYREDSDVVG
ncbi:putative glutathione-dependent formaldehyde-activating enzyme like protein [Verticillium longisporum]